MADTTADRVRSIAKHLNKVEVTTLEMYIDDAKLEMEKHKVPDKYHEKLQRYLAAHFATLDYRRPETQKIGDLQTSYKSPGEESKSNGLEGTEYGKEYNRLLKIALGSKGINLVVF